MASGADIPQSMNICLSLIPRNAQKIALVGTASAVMGTAFHQMSPKAKQERFPNIRRFLDHLKTAPETVYDGVVLQSQPGAEGFTKASLIPLFAHVAKDGVLLLDVVNPFYFKQVERKLAKSGPLDETLLAAIGQKSDEFSKRLTLEIQAAGFRVDHISRLPDTGFVSWVNQSPLTAHLKNETKEKLARIALSPSFVFRLTKAAAVQIRIQSKTLKPVGGVNDVRINEPLAAMGTIPGVRTHAGQAPTIQQGGGKLQKVFIWQRPVMSFEQSLQMVQELRKAGYLIIVEFDDHPSPWPMIAENNFLTFAGAHAVQTTNEALADLIRAHNPEVGVFPNQLNRLPFRSLRQANETARIFFGALNRENDYKDILPEINKAISAFEGAFHFDVMGDETFFEGLETDQKSYQKRSDYGGYRKALAQTDIALMPLAENTFNQMKSDLKLIEAAGAGAVAVASDTVYASTDPDSEFSEICRTPEAFGAALVQLVNDPAYRLSKQRKARAYVQDNRLLGDHYMARYVWIRGLLDRRTELDQELEGRLAAITPQA